MRAPTVAEVRQAILDAIPGDGSPVGNISLRTRLAEALGREVPEMVYNSARDALVDEGLIAKGQGRGGSVRLANPSAAPVLMLESREIPADALRPKPKQTALPMGKRQVGQVAKPKGGAGEEKVVGYRHKDHRINNPEVGLVTPDDDPDQPKTTWAYDPHIDPALQFDVTRSQIERLVDDALASGDEAMMRDALQALRKRAEPYLNWTGKAERTSFEVDTVSLHVHERIDPATILGRIKKQLKRGKGVSEPQQQDWLRAWFDRPLPLREAIEFYKHDRGWSNRLIAGDSLLVMNSLLQKESMAGQVQMIYIDPPYGIKYGSNFQPFVNNQAVKDRKDEDLTQEPEMIKAFRDTWELGIHSYLTYLRDRLLLAKELLNESGSVFVQISDENLHHVREICDEIFGATNMVALITTKKTSGAGSFSGTTNVLPAVADYLVWYCKDKSRVKYRELLDPKGGEDFTPTAYNKVMEQDGRRRSATNKEKAGEIPLGGHLYSLDNLVSQTVRTGQTTVFEVEIGGRVYLPKGGGWKTNREGMSRLVRAKRIEGTDERAGYVRLLEDFRATKIANVWVDTVSSFMTDKIYVVQTNIKVIERCLLMTTDPGDLVLDPTCGSGTTAFVAEKWGRRWVTCDTSRVAVTLAKQRLMTASYDYYELKYPHEGLKAGFIYKTIPHITLKSIANNPEIDTIYDRDYPTIALALSALNAHLKSNHPAGPFTVTEGVRKGEALNFERGDSLHEWEVPFDFPIEWPSSARAAFDAFHAARQTMQKHMDASIASHAESEILYDKPEPSKTRLRVSGPFTVEAVPFPSVASLDAADTALTAEADTTIVRSGESLRQHSWRDELMKTGIRGKGGQILKFAALETLPDTRYLHVTGALAETGERIVVSFGPEYAALEQRQVELALNEAEKLRPAPKLIAFAAFTFDPEAAKDIDETRWPGVALLKVQMNTDLLTEDLKKARASNQSFWLMGQPDVELRKLKDGRYQVEVHGFDYFDTTKGDLVSGGKSKIAMWSLDTDYDERSLFPSQVFFPMAGKKDGWEKLKKDIKAELDEGSLAKFHGTVSLPFEPGDNRKVAVKIVDDRGIESLKIIAID